MADYTPFNPSAGEAYLTKFTNFFNQLTSDVTSVENDIATAQADILALQTGSYLTGTSLTSETIATGSKTFTIVESDRAWGDGTNLKITDTANSANFMIGTTDTYSGNTLNITISSTGGSGTKSDWTITVVTEDSGKADKAVPSSANNVALLDASGNLLDSTRGLPGQSNLAISGLRAGVLSLDNTVLTDVQNSTLHTGNGTSQSPDTGIPNEDINWVTGTVYAIGDVRFTLDGTGVTASAFTLWECNTGHTAGAVGLGTDTLGDSVWTEVSDNDVKNHNNALHKIKNRDAADSWVWVDTLRGVGNILSSDTTAAEAADVDTVTAFTATGFTVGADVKVNTNLEKYVTDTVGFHKVMITTVDAKRVLIAFDDVNNRGIRLRQGSGAAIDLPHGLNTDIKYSVSKNTDAVTNWAVFFGDETDYMLLNSTIAGTDDSTYWNDTAPTISVQTLGTNADVNTIDEVYFDYYSGDSDNIKIVEYSGAAAAGNEIYLGDDFTPDRGTIKRIDTTDDWHIVDNARADSGDYLLANSTAVEATGGGHVDFTSTGITLQSTDAGFNALGGRYILIAYRDTDADGGGSESSLPSDTTNAQIASGSMAYSDGYDGTGATNTSETLSGTIIPSNGWQEGINYCKRVEGTEYISTLVAPVFGETSSTADYNIDGVWYNSSDVAYTPPIGYCPYTFKADASGNISVIEPYNLPSVSEKTIHVNNIEGLDKPLFRGYLTSNLTGVDLIFPWTTQIDTHNAMNGGVYTIPKTGYYNISISIYHDHQSATANSVAWYMYKNGAIAPIQSSSNFTYGDNTNTRYRLISVELKGVYFEKGDTFYLITFLASASDFVYAHIDGSRMSIEYIGNKLTTGQS
jgi:hypothetical protein